MEKPIKKKQKNPCWTELGFVYTSEWIDLIFIKCKYSGLFMAEFELTKNCPEAFRDGKMFSGISGTGKISAPGLGN